MAEIADLEQTLLETVRSLSSDQQQAVLNFARTLSESSTITAPAALPPLKLSLQQLAKLPISDRNQLLAPSVAAMAEDFQNDPELTEFSVLNTED